MTGARGGEAPMGGGPHRTPTAKSPWSLRCMGTFRPSSPQSSLSGDGLPAYSGTAAARTAQTMSSAGSRGGRRFFLAALTQSK
eukprot:5607130-Alexandrium_andersonii.AAC.1